MRIVYIGPFPSYFTNLIILYYFLFYFSLLLSNPILVFSRIDIITRIL